MKGIKAILNAVKTVEKIVLIALFIVIVLTTFLQVVGRYTPLPFSKKCEEIATFSFVWATMIGAGTCVREGGHMTMDFVVSYLPRSKRIYVKLIGDIAAALVGVGILRAAKLLIPRVKRAGMISSAMSLPLWIQELAVAVGAALILLWAVVNIVEDVSKIVRGERLPDPPAESVKED